MKSIRNTIIAAAAALATVGSATAGVMPTMIANDEGGPPAQLITGVYTTGDAVTLEQAQWAWGGRNYCWYGGGWQGPGYYWCGYAWRRGFGWGGPAGWNGWRGGGWHGGRGGWRGGHGGWRGGRGGWRGGHGGGHGGGHRR